MTNRLTRNSEESEKAIEKYLCNEVRKLGGLCLKYTNPHATGYPDRIILLKGVPDIWVELKSKGCTPSALQVVRIERLRELGRMVYICDSRKKVDSIVRSAARLMRKKAAPESLLRADQNRGEPQEPESGCSTCQEGGGDEV